MPNVWPSSVHRAHIPARLAGEGILAVMLVATLAFSPRDGAPVDRSAVLAVPVPALMSPFGQAALPDSQSLSALATTAEVSVSGKALIPTAPPAQLLIPALNVHRAVETVSVNRSGVMNLPINAWNAGWYGGGPIPGAPGDAVIEGHAGYPDQPMIFGKLGKLHAGDQIIVVLSDGSRRLFLVDSMATVPVGSAPPGMAEPYGPPRLTLITCTGYFNKSSYSYSERLVVEASYAGVV
jgi:LPXTG-site transpeptidase (sortase) family protein